MTGEVARLLDLNQEQTRAVVDGGRDILVSAGAGTGKTRVLVARYLTLILEYGYRPGGIAAITFTNKAAAEMRERVRQGLIALAGQFPAAHELMPEIDWAPIQTIHSFCGQLLRADPLAAGVTPGFGMLEEGEAGLLLAEACDLALGSALAAEAELGGLDELLATFGRRRLLRLLGQAYQAFCRWGLDLGLINGETGTEEAMARARENLARWWDEMMRLPVPPNLAPGTKSALQDLHGLDDDVRAYFALPGIGRDDWLWQEIGRLLGGLKAADFTAPAVAGREIIFNAAVAASAALAARVLPAFLGLAATAAAEFEKLKYRRAALDFADLEIRTRKLLANEEARRSVQSRYAVLLIDEFQDTSPLQWSIVQALREGPGGCRLFAVGDAKQSIYRFRGADVRVMENLRRELAAGGGIYSLQDNYRCQPSLAALVNLVCEPLLGPHTVYEPLRPTKQDHMAITRVEAALFAEELDRATEAAYIANRAAMMLAGADPFPVKPGDIALLFRAATDVHQYEKALREADLPYRVLSGGGFYRRDEVADLLNLLAAVENEGDGVALASVLRSPLFGISDGGLYRIAREQGLTTGFARYDADAAELGEDGPPLLGARKALDYLRAHRHLLSLDQILAQAIEATDYWALQTALPDYYQRLANMDKLLRLARQYANLGRGEPGEFLAYLEALDAMEAREGEASLSGGEGAISLLTVHRAKGLEFPVVFLPDLGRALAGQNPDVLVDEAGRIGFRFGPPREGRASPIWNAIDASLRAAEEEEMKRLLYVALTRARDYLVLVGSGPRRGVSWLNWLREALPLDAPGEIAAYHGGSIRIGHAVTTAPAEGASRKLADIHPGIRSGQRIAPLPETAAAREPEPLPQSGSVATLTVSQALDLRTCPRRFFLRHILGLLASAGETGEGTGGGGTALGVAVHQLAAAMVLDAPGSDIAPLLPPPSGEHGLDAEDEEALRRLLDNYRQCRSLRAAMRAAMVWREYEFHATVAGGILVGTVDLLWIDAEQRIYLADLKTNRVETPGGELLAEQTYQLQLYALALARIFGRPVTGAWLEYLWPGVSIEAPTDAASLAESESALRAMFDLSARPRHPREFSPRPSPMCTWCGFAGERCGPA